MSKHPSRLRDKQSRKGKPKGARQRRLSNKTRKGKRARRQDGKRAI